VEAFVACQTGTCLPEEDSKLLLLPRENFRLSFAFIAFGKTNVS
jgi:hypothetical protein